MDCILPTEKTLASAISLPAPCVAFLLIKDNQVLIEKRRADKKIDPGLMAIPGGHIEAGESQQDAVKREIREELGVEPDALSYLDSHHHFGDEHEVIHYYVVTAWQGEPQAFEAASLHWLPLQPSVVDSSADQLAILGCVRFLENSAC
uniref:NUDIX hydrolase n=1 Tax=Thaumasiovibrio occultus TaxID=1891184 RepID=UPI000B363B73|nr:NUDIX domain-containing protein [Thaumasiovibrio occultus]